MYPLRGIDIGAQLGTGGGPSGGSGQAQFGSKSMEMAVLGSGAVQAQKLGTQAAAAKTARDTTGLQSLKGTKFSQDGGGVQWDTGGLGGARATYTTGVGFVEASGGIGIKGNSLAVQTVDASVYCPPGQAVKSVQTFSLGGTSNTLAWPYSEENRTVDVHFEGARLLDPDSVPVLGLCSGEGALFTVNRSLDLIFVFFCQESDGGITIQEQQVTFPIPVDLKCYRDSRFRATARSVQFRHECTPGYSIKSTGQPAWEGPAGWADPKVCVKNQ